MFAEFDPWLRRRLDPIAERDAFIGVGRAALSDPQGGVERRETHQAPSTSWWASMTRPTLPFDWHIWHG